MIRRSLALRLASWYCGVLLVLGAGFAAYTAIGFTRYVDATSRRTLMGRAEEIWNFARPLLGDRAALAASIRNRFEPEGQNHFIRISVDDAVLYRSGPPVQGTFDPGRIPLPRPRAAGRLIHEAGLYVVAEEFKLPDGRAAVVESGHPDAVLRDARRGLETSLMIALPVFLTIAATGGWVLVQHALGPVSQMIIAAEALSFNSPEKRLPLLGALEPIASLGQSLNRMLDQLDNAYQHVGQFSAEIAHELRTPLTIIHGELELIQRTAELPDYLRSSLGGVLQETAHLAHIVESLITLSRMGSFWGKQAHLPVDLRELIVETVEQMRLLAEDKAVALECEAADAVLVMADRTRLKQVLSESRRQCRQIYSDGRAGDRVFKHLGDDRRHDRRRQWHWHCIGTSCAHFRALISRRRCERRRRRAWSRHREIYLRGAWRQNRSDERARIRHDVPRGAAARAGRLIGVPIDQCHRPRRRVMREF